MLDNINIGVVFLVMNAIFWGMAPMLNIAN